MLYDWAGLFGTLRRYVEVFRRVLPTTHSYMQAESEPPQTMHQQDLAATAGWIRLATAIAKHVRALDNLIFSVPTLFSAQRRVASSSSATTSTR